MCRCGGLGEHEHLLDANSITKRSLFDYIQLSQCSALNVVGGDISCIIQESFLKGINERYLRSDADDQILLHIQFTSPVKIKSIRIACPESEDFSPTCLMLYVNNIIDFNSVNKVKCTQQIPCLSEADHKGEAIDYPVKAHLFGNVQSLSMFLSNSRQSETRIMFLGFTGEFLNIKHAPILTQYELKPNVADHKIEGDWQRAGHSRMGLDAALQATDNSGLQAALDWIEQHPDHEDKGKDIVVEGASSEPKVQNPKEDANLEPTAPEGFKKAIKCNTCDKTFGNVELAQLHATKTGHDDFSEALAKQLTEEEKAAKLQDLKSKLEEKRAAEAALEKEKELENERIRRKAGKDSEDLKRERERKQIEKIRQEQEREKTEAKIAKERVLAMIEEDRKERERRLGALPTESEPKKEAPLKPPTPTDVARVQVKLPDGRSLKYSMQSKDTFNELLGKISEDFPPIASHTLLLVPDNRPLVPSDHLQSLEALGMSPSATLMLQ